MHELWKIERRVCNQLSLVPLVTRGSPTRFDYKVRSDSKPKNPRDSTWKSKKNRYEVAPNFSVESTSGALGTREGLWTFWRKTIWRKVQFGKKKLTKLQFGEKNLMKSTICQNNFGEGQFDEYKFAEKTIWRDKFDEK